MKKIITGYKSIDKRYFFWGSLILLVVLIHIPASIDVFNYFDVPKRLVWSALALFLALRSFQNQNTIPKGIYFSLLACLLWIVGRSIVREHPFIEIEVLVTWLLPFLLFAVGLAVDRDKVIRPLAWGLVIAGVIQAIIMLLQFIGKDPFFADTTSLSLYRPGRMIGTVGYHNQAAHFLALSYVGLLILVRNRTFRLLAFAAIFAVVGLTGSRGAIVAFAFSIVTVEVIASILSRSNAKKHILRLGTVLVVLLLVVAGLFIAMPSVRNRFTGVITNPAKMPAVASRAVMAKIASNMIIEKPIIGWGAGEFAFQYLDRLKYVVPAEEKYRIRNNIVFAREAHNDYLQFAAEFGIIGLIILLILLFFVLRRLWQTRKKEQLAIICCLFILLYMSIVSMVSFPWQYSVAGPLTALMLGIMIPRIGEDDVAYEGRNLQKMLFPALAHVPYLMAIVLLTWNIVDSLINMTLPMKLYKGESSKLAATIPRCMHKYHSLIGAKLAGDGTYNNALSELQLAYSGYRDILLYNNLGNVLSKMGRWQEAAVVYQEWADIGLDHDKALGNLSVAYEQLGDFENAAATMDRKMSLWREYDVTAVQRVAALYLRVGRTDDALRVLDRFEGGHLFIAEKVPAEYDNLRGAVLLTMGDCTAAKSCFISALRKNPQLQSAKRNLENCK